MDCLRKPHAQGVCERINQTILRDLSTLILDNKKYNNYEGLEDDYQKIIYDYNNLELHRHNISLYFYSIIILKIFQ